MRKLKKLVLGNPEDLVEKLQREVSNSANWLTDNRLCDNEHEGVITQPRKRVGILKRLFKFMSKKRLVLLSDGFF